jgi:hypothetical protein
MIEDDPCDASRERGKERGNNKGNLMRMGTEPMTTCYMTVGFTSHAEAEDLEALADELAHDVSALEGLQTVAPTTTGSVPAGTKGTPAIEDAP